MVKRSKPTIPEKRFCPDCGRQTLEIIEIVSHTEGEYKEIRTCPECGNMVYIFREV